MLFFAPSLQDAHGAPVSSSMGILAQLKTTSDQSMSPSDVYGLAAVLSSGRGPNVAVTSALVMDADGRIVVFNAKM